MRRGRLLVVLLLSAGLGLALSLVLARPAAGFPPGVCTGNSCVGSDTASWGTVECQPGSYVYWEDSYIPADVLNPHVVKFSETPNPPCTGATVSAPAADPWPASATDPDGKPAPKKEAGKAIFRFRWTVTVPSGSKPAGSLSVSWTLGWTKPQGTTETVGTTTTSERDKRFDLEVQVTVPDRIAIQQAPRRIEIKVNVFNNGPGWSPRLDGTLPGLKLSAYLWATPLTPTQLPAACRTAEDIAICNVKPLAPQGEESFTLGVLYSSAVRDLAVERAKAGKKPVIAVAATVLLSGWKTFGCWLDTNCANNLAREEIPVH